MRGEGMSKHLELDLEHLHRDILAQSGAVEQAICRAIRALQECDVNLARQVSQGDDRINEQENRIEEECLKMLAVHQPVAADLRRITAVLKINTGRRDLARAFIESYFRASADARPGASFPVQADQAALPAAPVG
jgi:phosphate transport system protein